LFPFYFFSITLGIIRLLMFVEYTDLEYICKGLADLFTLPFPEGIKKHTLKNILFQLTLLSVYMLLVSHMCACVFLVMEREALPGSSTSSQDPGLDKYITTLYFLITTSTVVGYGDVTINHKADKLVFLRYGYQVFIMLFSVIINGVFYAIINSLVRDSEEDMRKIKIEVELFYPDR
jgi:hypothetical protein